MFRAFISIACFLTCSLVYSSPLLQRAVPTACFITGTTDPGAEVDGGIPALAASTTCSSTKSIGGVPDVTSGGISFSSVDFTKSKLSPLGFALQTFTTPSDPAKADLKTLQAQLDVYMATEAGLRSTGSSLVSQIKAPRFFLMFQKARVLSAQGVPDSQLGDSVDGGEALTSVAHQLAKVVKNKGSATSAEVAAVSVLAATK